jgi:hypothetical protein
MAQLCEFFLHSIKRTFFCFHCWIVGCNNGLLARLNEVQLIPEKSKLTEPREIGIPFHGSFPPKIFDFNLKKFTETFIALWNISYLGGGEGRPNFSCFFCSDQ